MNKLIILSLVLISAVILTGTLTVALQQPQDLPVGSPLKTFASQEELEKYIKDGIRRGESIYVKDSFIERSGPMPVPAPGFETTSMAQNGDGYSTTTEFSTTNIQVAGVDEADIVKTDGRFIYLASNNQLIIVEAYPPGKMKIVSSTFVEGSILGLFVNGDRLLIFEDAGYYPKPVPEFDERTVIPPPMSPGAYIKVYDITDRESPTLVREILLNGVYVNSRMIGDYVYVVASQPAVYWVREEPEAVLPTIYTDGKAEDVPAIEIYYSDSSDIPAEYTVIVALNIQADAVEPEYEVILTGYASTIYVSQRNIYLTMPSGDWWTGQGSTTIHRVSIDGSEIAIEANGEVPGTVLNQFSMDEYQGYFRIATTSYDAESSTTTANNVYVLDTDLDIVGMLENLAPGEHIYSARFIAGRCYLVTFKNVDPLFTIDLSSPEEPKVLGKLKIPGYSDYLHPYDENHLIGIGKETVEAKQEDFAWYQGVKISLFDVSDVESPKEVGKLVIGDRGTDSPVLRDHHALLFDKSRDLLVIPVLEAKIFPEKYPQGVTPEMYGEYVFQGAYILNISPEEGISIKGRVTHVEDQEIYLKSGEYIDQRFEIRRSLYIDDSLYTISDAKIKANNIWDLSETAKIDLPY